MSSVCFQRSRLRCATVAAVGTSQGGEEREYTPTATLGHSSVPARAHVASGFAPCEYWNQGISATHRLLAVAAGTSIDVYDAFQVSTVPPLNSDRLASPPARAKLLCSLPIHDKGVCVDVSSLLFLKGNALAVAGYCDHGMVVHVYRLVVTASAGTPPPAAAPPANTAYAAGGEVERGSGLSAFSSPLSIATAPQYSINLLPHIIFRAVLPPGERGVQLVPHPYSAHAFGIVLAGDTALRFYDASPSPAAHVGASGEETARGALISAVPQRQPAATDASLGAINIRVPIAFAHICPASRMLILSDVTHAVHVFDVSTPARLAAACTRYTSCTAPAGSPRPHATAPSSGVPRAHAVAEAHGGGRTTGLPAATPTTCAALRGTPRSHHVAPPDNSPSPTSRASAHSLRTPRGEGVQARHTFAAAPGARSVRSTQSAASCATSSLASTSNSFTRTFSTVKGASSTQRCADDPCIARFGTEALVTAVSVLHIPAPADAVNFAAFKYNHLLLLTGHANGFLNVWWLGNLQSMGSEPAPEGCVRVPPPGAHQLASYPPFHASRGAVTTISVGVTAEEAVHGRSLLPSTHPSALAPLEASSEGAPRVPTTSTLVAVGAVGARGWRMYTFDHVLPPVLPQSARQGFPLRASDMARARASRVTYTWDAMGKRQRVEPTPADVSHCLAACVRCPTYAECLRAPIIGDMFAEEEAASATQQAGGGAPPAGLLPLGAVQFCMSCVQKVSTAPVCDTDLDDYDASLSALALLSEEIKVPLETLLWEHSVFRVLAHTPLSSAAAATAAGGGHEALASYVQAPRTALALASTSGIHFVGVDYHTSLVSSIKPALRAAAALARVRARAVTAAVAAAAAVPPPPPPPPADSAAPATASFATMEHVAGTPASPDGARLHVSTDARNVGSGTTGAAAESYENEHHAESSDSTSGGGAANHTASGASAAALQKVYASSRARMGRDDLEASIRGRSYWPTAAVMSTVRPSRPTIFTAIAERINNGAEPSAPAPAPLPSSFARFAARPPPAVQAARSASDGGERGQVGALGRRASSTATRRAAVAVPMQTPRSVQRVHPQQHRPTSSAAEAARVAAAGDAQRTDVASAVPVRALLSRQDALRATPQAASMTHPGAATGQSVRDAREGTDAVAEVAAIHASGSAFALLADTTTSLASNTQASQMLMVDTASTSLSNTEDVRVGGIDLNRAMRLPAAFAVRTNEGREERTQVQLAETLDGERHDEEDDFEGEGDMLEPLPHSTVPLPEDPVAVTLLRSLQEPGLSRAPLQGMPATLNADAFAAHVQAQAESTLQSAARGNESGVTAATSAVHEGGGGAGSGMSTQALHSMLSALQGQIAALHSMLQNQEAVSATRAT